MTAPPEWAIEKAIAAARESPCQKSKRGVVVYADDPCMVPDGSLGTGTNGSPSNANAYIFEDERPGLPIPTCDGSAACRAMCGQHCVHAETRAILHMVRARMMGTAHAHPDLVHVKVVGRKLVAGGPPSCWPCANLVIEVGIGNVWLYEDMWEGPRWQRWSAADFYAATLQRQPAHPLYLKRNAIEVPCGDKECGKQDGAKRDRKGFWRCIKCGYPSP